MTGRRAIVGALGATQILAWGSSYYLLAVLATPIVADTGWPLAGVTGGLSLALVAAGLVSSLVGRAVLTHGGRRVLATSAALFGLGLATVGLAPNLAIFLTGWLIVGVGMGSGLYDAVFATLGDLYGRSARRAITAITLYGGFASTVCWPISAWLSESFGWRAACLVYAAAHLAASLPLILFAIPKGRGDAPMESAPITGEDVRTPRGAAIPALATALALSATVTSIVAVQLLILLQGAGASLAAAVALGMLIGPAQVGARFLELVVGARFHPLWSMLAAAVLIASGLLMMTTGLALTAPGLVIYAAGAGLWSIARGSVPLALFGGEGYARNMGTLVRPALIASASAPFLAGLLYETGGVDLTEAALSGLALVTVAVVGGVIAACPPRSRTT